MVIQRETLFEVPLRDGRMAEAAPGVELARTPHRHRPHRRHHPGPPNPPSPPVVTTAILVRNRLISETIADCTVTIVGGPHPIGGKTNAHGRVSLNLSSLPDGVFTLRVVPKDVFTGVVGPGVPATLPGPDRVWRTLDAPVTVKGGRIVASSHADVSVSGGRVTAKVQPVWMKSPNRASAVRQPAATTLIVVHHTAGSSSESALNTFMNRHEGRSAHYLIDTDGQIIKMVHENRASFHAGVSHWAGTDNVNTFSVGIEIVNAGGPYTPAQVTAVVDLLGRIRAALPSIPADNVVGHSDIGTCPAPKTSPRCVHAHPRRLGRKSSDPGSTFPWERVEATGLGIRVRRAAPAKMYGDFFTAVPGARLMVGDNDAHRHYGGKHRPAITSNIVRELQTDLSAIGYFCPVTGRYGVQTQQAVAMFQEHFFSGSRTRSLHVGQFDVVTATAVKRVRP